jgi:subtilisin family serine protease
MKTAVCGGRGYSLRFVLSFAFVVCLAVPRVFAQAPDSTPPANSESAEAASPDPQQEIQPQQPGFSTVPEAPPQSAANPEEENLVEPANPVQTAPPPQPKRILGLMPNFRAVSAGTVPPPPSLKESFLIATRNSFDYSAFVFVGITSLLAEADNTHPQLGGGVDGFAKYYWRGWVDKTDGNYWFTFILPTLLHEDERYYAMGEGGPWKRLTYSASRILITPNYHGHNTFNASEIFGRAISQAISLSYYPSQTRTPGGIAQKYGYAVGRDALTNVFREFWPDIAVHVLHRHP